MARLGTDPHVVEHILNHQTGTLSQIAKIYNRHAYLPEKAKALQMWADHIQRYSQIEVHKSAGSRIAPSDAYPESAPTDTRNIAKK